MKFHLLLVFGLSLMLTACGSDTPTVSDGADFETSLAAVVASELDGKRLPIALKVIERRAGTDAIAASDNVIDAFDAALFPAGNERLDGYAKQVLGPDYMLELHEYRLQQQMRGNFLSKGEELNYRTERRKRYEEAKKRALYADTLYRKWLSGLTAEDILPLGARMLREEHVAELAAFDERVQKLDGKIKALKDEAKSSEDFLKQIEVGFPPEGVSRRNDPVPVRVVNRSQKNLATITLQVIAVGANTRTPMQQLHTYRIDVPAGAMKVFRTHDFMKWALDIQAAGNLPGAPFDSYDLAIVAATRDQGEVFNIDVEPGLEKLDFEMRTLVEDRHALMEKHRQELARLEVAS